MASADRIQNGIEVARVIDADKTYAASGAAVHAVRGASLTIRAGECVALVGASGCGKSTLLNMLAGVDRADRGQVFVCGLELNRSTSTRDLVDLRRTRIGIVFQSFHLVPHLRVEENVALPLALAGKKDRERVHMLLERVGLAARRSHYPSELSGGEQQRTAVARALVHRPQLLLADEPTGNLDSNTGAEILALLDEARRSEGAALLIVTHDPAVARRADRILHMADGRLTASVP